MGILNENFQRIRRMLTKTSKTWEIRPQPATAGPVVTAAARWISLKRPTAGEECANAHSTSQVNICFRAAYFSCRN